MKTLILAATAAAATLIGGAALAQPYGYAQPYSYAQSYDRGAYGGYDRGAAYRYADRDRDGIPDRYDRYDNRRARWAWEHRHRHHDWRHDRYDRDDRRW